jgi:hypothetical protein
MQPGSDATFENNDASTVNPGHSQGFQRNAFLIPA